MIRRRATAVLAALTLGVSVAAAQPAAAATDPLKPVASLDVPGYLGTWYQVAAVPQIFTLQCWSDTKAEYALVDADTISVRNSCLTLAKTPSSITGTADVLDPTTNAQLRVTFPSVPQFGDRNKPNYVVTYQSADKKIALVGDPDRRSGFVLSRTAALTSAQWREVKTAIAEAGYSNLAYWTTPQAGGETRPRNLALVN